MGGIVIFCSACGQEDVDRQNKFCLNCGQKLRHHTIDDENDLNKTPANLVLKKESSHKKQEGPIKIVIGLLVAVIALSFVSYKWVLPIFDAKEKLYAMDLAIGDGDVDEFMTYLQLVESANIDEASYFEYIKEVEWDNVYAQLDDYLHVKTSSNAVHQYDVLSEKDGVLFEVIIEPKLFGLYKDMELHAIPSNLLVPKKKLSYKAIIDGVEYPLNKMKKDEVIGQYYPGTYDIKVASKKDEQVLYEKILYIEGYEQLYLPIVSSDKKYTFKTEKTYNDAILYINGLKSEYTLADLTEGMLLTYEDDDFFHAEWDDGTGRIVRSNTIYLKDSNEKDKLNFDFDERNTSELRTDNEKEMDVGSFVLSFRDAYEDAVNTGEYWYIERFLQVNSEVESGLKEFVADMRTGNYHYNFTINTITAVKEINDKQYEVDTNEMFVFTDTDGLVYDYDRIKKYHVDEVAGGYELVKIDYVDTKKKLR